MELSPNQKIVLRSLTTEWQTPVQLANQLPKATGNLSDVQVVLKDFLREGLVQINPAVVGLYRLTQDGITIKKLELETT